MVMDADLLLNKVRALAVPLTADELSGIEHLARVKRAALLKQPQPKKPGLRAWFQRVFLKAWSSWTDYRAFSKEIAKQAERICVLEDLLEKHGIALPGGRSDE